MTAGKDMERGFASSLTDAGPRDSRSIIARRVGSASAWNVKSRGAATAFAKGADTFLLQSLSEPLDAGKLQLFTDFAKELVAFVDLDRAVTQKRL